MLKTGQSIGKYIMEFLRKKLFISKNKNRCPKLIMKQMVKWGKTAYCFKIDGIIKKLFIKTLMQTVFKSNNYFKLYLFLNWSNLFH